MKEPIWIVGRAFVYGEEGEVEYFLRFEEGQIRSFCGGLRPVELCRPLEYVCNTRYLRRYGAAREDKP